jgi:predicted neuraminidase
VQPSIVRLPDNSTGEGKGELLAFFRSRRRDNVWRARSFDEGRSWSEPKRTPLPNPNKSVQALTLQSGATALVFNNNRCVCGPTALTVCTPRVIDYHH